MSSRALRKLQREQEQERLAKLQENKESEEEEDEAVEPPTSRPKANAFDMLNATDEDDKDEEENAEEPGVGDSEEAKEEEEEKASAVIEENTNPGSLTQREVKGQTKRRNKKKAKKRKEPSQKEESHNPGQTSETNRQQAQMDEIDLALLSLKEKKTDAIEKNDEQTRPGEDLEHLYLVLGTDTKYLNALNEMKRLFGNAVLEGETPEPAGRRRGRGAQQVDLGGALAGRNSPISRGQGLAGLALRRNVLMLGKEEWPKATSGGLGMEVVEKAWDLTTEYRFVHNSSYQDVQRQFESCVDSMDPQRMIQLLQFNRKDDLLP